MTQGSNKQVVILNDRCQAGAAEIERGTIELMQQRRLLQDDVRGVIEPLNEVDNEGVGLRVNARYYMQIFDRSKGNSLQRQQQIYVDQPLQYFFTTNFTQQGSANEKQFFSTVDDQFENFTTSVY